MSSLVAPAACARCRSPLGPDLAILADAQHQGRVLNFVPLRCRHGHTARVELPARPVRYVPTCGYCGGLVLERRRGSDGSPGKGAAYLNHPHCYGSKNGPIKPHRFVEIPA